MRSAIATVSANRVAVSDVVDERSCYYLVEVRFRRGNDNSGHAGCREAETSPLKISRRNMGIAADTSRARLARRRPDARGGDQVQ